MFDNLIFYYNRLQEKLWVKPVFVCFLSIVAALIAHAVDETALNTIVPEISTESIKNLLIIMGSSMLSIATFAVASMVSAYASASSVATPRTFLLVIADDNSQNALSAFVGAFIFSIVGSVALLNDYFGTAGRFFLFIITVVIFAVVVITFVRWVDSIARLGRLGSIINKVEAATEKAFSLYREDPRQGGAKTVPLPENAIPLRSHNIGYIQYLNVVKLSKIAEELNISIQMCAMPGDFLDMNEPFAHIIQNENPLDEQSLKRIESALTIGRERVYDKDPRFGMIVLSEIASRALSAAVNDPGTAIHILGSQLRLINAWKAPFDENTRTAPQTTKDTVRFTNVHIPTLNVNDVFVDSFARIARDGASTIEVMMRLQKTLRSLSDSQDADIRHAAKRLGATVLSRSNQGLTLDYEKDTIKQLSDFCTQADELS